MNSSRTYPVADLHCDLLSYMANVKGASLQSTEDIGATLPWLRKGNVKLQVTAVFTRTGPESVLDAQKQLLYYAALAGGKYFCPVTSIAELEEFPFGEKTGIIPAFENASGLAEETEPLHVVLERVEDMRLMLGNIFYIGFTHHTENRFGGGNFSDNVGLKHDGEALLDYLSGKNICVDLAHASDALAYGILNYIDKNRLRIPVIASHSNFRALTPHVRNLPDELVQEIVNRGGLIGINFFREYVNETRMEAIFEHILYGKSAGGPNHLCLGADFFYIHDITEKSRHPLFFDQLANAGSYPYLLSELEKMTGDTRFVSQFSLENVVSFLQKLWGDQA